MKRTHTLEQLVQLQAEGKLTEAEFAQAKAEVLEGGSAVAERSRYRAAGLVVLVLLALVQIFLCAIITPNMEKFAADVGVAAEARASLAMAVRLRWLAVAEACVIVAAGCGAFGRRQGGTMLVLVIILLALQVAALGYWLYATAAEIVLAL